MSKSVTVSPEAIAKAASILFKLLRPMLTEIQFAHFLEQIEAHGWEPHTQKSQE